MPNSPSDDHGWSSVPVAMDGEKGPWLGWRQCTSAGQGWPSVPVAKTRTGRSRLERRHGWQGAVMARRDLVHCPVSGVGRLNGSLLFCLRKDVALVSHCVLGLGRWNGKLCKSCKLGTVLDLRT
ncbi:hypothetical protein [Desulfosporosinus burensis]